MKVDHTWLRAVRFRPPLRDGQDRVYDLPVLVVQRIQVLGGLEMSRLVTDLMHGSDAAILPGRSYSFVVNLVQSLQVALVCYLSLEFVEGFRGAKHWV